MVGYQNNTSSWSIDWPSAVCLSWSMGVLLNAASQICERGRMAADICTWRFHVVEFCWVVSADVLRQRREMGEKTPFKHVG